MSRKRPKQKENVRGKKTPFQGGNPDAYMSKKPCWRFSNCDKSHELKIAEDTLFSLAPEGKLRLYGRLYDGVFDILWIDLEHEVCTSNKKHT